MSQATLTRQQTAEQSDESAVEARPQLAVVVPLANESATVDEFLNRIGRQLLPTDNVFCVLDHASKDDTRQRVESRAAIDSRIVPVWAPENRSVVDAYFRGYWAALSSTAEWILEMDGGFSHAPEDIPHFVAAMRQGFDYAAGSRFARNGAHRGSLTRRWLSYGGTQLTNALLGTRMRDMTSGFECFTREALTYVVAQGVRSRRHFFQTEIRCLLRDWNWVEVPITYTAPSPRLGRAAVIEALQILWWLRRQQAGLATQRCNTDASSRTHRLGIRRVIERTEQSSRRAA